MSSFRARLKNVWEDRSLAEAYKPPAADQAVRSVQANLNEIRSLTRQRTLNRKSKEMKGNKRKYKGIICIKKQMFHIVSHCFTLFHIF